MPPTTDHAFALRQLDWSETSQIAVLLTRDHGLVRGLAKGSRRYRSSFDGGIEPLSVGHLEAIYRADRELLTFTGWSIATHHPRMRRSLPTYAAAMYLAELLLRSLAPLDPHPRLYATAVALMRRLDEVPLRSNELRDDSGDETARQAAARVAALAIVGVMDEVGFRPAGLDAANTLEPGKVIRFSPSEGAFRISHDKDDETWPVSAMTAQAVASMLEKPDEAIVDFNASLRVVRMMSAWFAYCMGRELRSVRLFLRTVTVGGPDRFDDPIA